MSSRRQPKLLAGSLAGLLFLLTATGAGAATKELQRVLILESFGRDFAPWNAITPALKAALIERAPAPIEFHEAALETARAEETPAEEAFAKYLRALYAAHPPDLVVPLGGPAARFWLRYRGDLFPTAPAVIGGIDQRVLRTVALTSNETAVTTRFDLSGSVNLILSLLPATTRIVVVMGDSPIERFWVAECRQAWRPFTNRVQFVWLNKLSFPEIRSYVSALPPRSVLAYGLLAVDGAGVPQEQMAALDQVCAAANAPVFGLQEEQLGHGIIGGRLLLSGETLGRETARVAARVLAGEPPGKIPLAVLNISRPMFDWRELQRWHIPENRLPSDSVVRFRRLPAWERYRWHITGSLVVIIVQALTIAGLLVHRARRRRAEANLRENQQFMELATAAGELGLWVREAGNGELRVNSRLRALLGLPANGPVGLGDLLARIHPEDRAHAEQSFLRGTGTKATFEFEARLLAPEGTERWIAVKGLAAVDERHRPLRTEGVVFDITARKEAAERPRLILEAAPYAMIMVDRAGKMALVNPAAERIFGYARHELIGQPVEMLVPEPHRPGHPARRESFWTHGHVRLMGPGVEVFAQRKEGNLVPVEIHLNPITTGQGEFVLASILDLTARHEAELAAQRHRDELRHIGRVHVLGQLSSALAHELNQPLGAILSNAEAAELMLQGEAPAWAEVRAILADIRKDDQRASDVIHRMRALLRRREMERAPVPVRELVEECIALTRSDALERKVKVECSILPGALRVWGDRVHLEQVLLNLLVNGMDAMRNRPIAGRRLLLTVEPGRDHAVEFAVADFGPGLAPDQLDRIFESFYTTKPSGLGLGLSISRTIIEAHHGRIWAENNPDGGATFRFTLPAEEDKEQPA